MIRLSKMWEGWGSSLCDFRVTGTQPRLFCRLLALNLKILSRFCCLFIDIAVGVLVQYAEVLPDCRWRFIHLGWISGKKQNQNQQGASRQKQIQATRQQKHVELTLQSGKEQKKNTSTYSEWLMMEVKSCSEEEGREVQTTAKLNSKGSY